MAGEDEDEGRLGVATGVGVAELEVWGWSLILGALSCLLKYELLSPSLLLESLSPVCWTCPGDVYEVLRASFEGAFSTVTFGVTIGGPLSFSLSLHFSMDTRALGDSTNLLLRRWAPLRLPWIPNFSWLR